MGGAIASRKHVGINFVDSEEIATFADKFSNMNSEDKKTDKEPTMAKRLIGYGVKYLLPLALTVALVWYMFQKVNFSDIVTTLKSGVNYCWIIFAMIISVFSHVFRAMRWRLQLRGLGIDPPIMALCCSIFGTYALNLVFPRLGEVWRCTYIAQREKAPFTTVVGSMVADRLTDTLVVGLLTIFTFVVASGALTDFLVKYPVGQGLVDLALNPWLWVMIVVGIGLIWAVFHFLRDNKIIGKIRSMLNELWSGFMVVTKMKGRWTFAGLTLCIWGCYFMQLYVAFYAFSYTTELCSPELAYGLLPCLVAFVLSSIGMAIPSNGGLGPWNIAVMFGLAIYGISDAQGAAFSILVWSAQTIMLIILGIFTMGYISIGKKKTDK